VHQFDTTDVTEATQRHRIVFFPLCVSVDVLCLCGVNRQIDAVPSPVGPEGFVYNTNRALLEYFLPTGTDMMAATTFQTVVDRIDVLSYNVHGFRLRLAEPTNLAFEPGQFVIVHVPKDGSTVKRAYSIASPPHEAGVIELCIQYIEGGAASTFFWKLKEGMPVTMSGPHGRFTLASPLAYEPVFMATGTGVAPFRSMIQHLCHMKFAQPIWLLFGCRYEHAVLYEAEFRAIASLHHNLQYIPTVSRPKEWKGETGHIQQTFQKYIRDYANKEIYVCGFLEIVKAVVSDLKSFGVPETRVHYEEW